MRLVQLAGDMDNEGTGRVEYCSRGRWSLVCYDNWDTNDAKVICRQLRYNVEGRLIFLMKCFFQLIVACYAYAVGSVEAIDTRVGQGPPPTFLTKVDCVGTEERISQCPQDNSHECLNRGAGVVCPADCPKLPPKYSVKLRLSTVRGKKTKNVTLVDS